MADNTITDKFKELLSTAYLWEKINPEVLLADGFEDAYIGVCEVFNRPPLAAYDRDKCIEILMERDEMDYEDAKEYFDYNVVGSWVGDNTPVYISLSEKGD